MKQFFALLILLISMSSCQKDTINESFDCNTTTNFANTEEVQGILKHFKITIPSDWKSELYFDETQSRFYSADTTKQLSETYIVDVTWHQGELKFGKDFETLVVDDLKLNQQLTPIKSGFGEFKDFKGYYNLSKGFQSGFDYHFFQIFLITATDEYFTLTTKVYGTEFVNERICSSVSLFEKITFLD